MTEISFLTFMLFLTRYKNFFYIIPPAAIGGWLWASLHLPLAWLMGAALVTGFFSIRGVEITLPKSLYWPSLAIIGSSVGLTITPEVAGLMLNWLPFMVVMSFTGVVFAAILTPWVAHYGRMSPATAFFSLMPGGVIEMANIGRHYGADATIIPALHAIRVALVVGLLPMSLYLIFPIKAESLTPQFLSPSQFLMLFAVALSGGWVGKYLHLPANWLLGSLIFVGCVTLLGGFEGQVPPAPMAIAQIIVGISLGAKFIREKLQRIPSAIIAALPALLFIMTLMALIAIAFSMLLPFNVPTLILSFSIGGLAEMVLTAHALQLNIAIVAAFQSTRAILVNSCAGFIWSYLQRTFKIYKKPHGE